jgi:hypothetical protein
VGITAWYAHVYPQLERIAWRYGYALALHGSMARDLDVIAVPWTEDAEDKEKLLRAFAKAVSRTEHERIGVPTPTKKSPGRNAYSLYLGFSGAYLDVSVMPRRGR